MPSLLFLFLAALANPAAAQEAEEPPAAEAPPAGEGDSPDPVNTGGDGVEPASAAKEATGEDAPSDPEPAAVDTPTEEGPSEPAQEAATEESGGESSPEPEVKQVEDPPEAVPQPTAATKDTEPEAAPEPADPVEPPQPVPAPTAHGAEAPAERVSRKPNKPMLYAAGGLAVATAVTYGLAASSYNDAFGAQPRPYEDFDRIRRRTNTLTAISGGLAVVTAGTGLGAFIVGEF